MKRLSWLLSLILAVAASAWADATTPPLLSSDGNEHWYTIATYEQDKRPGIITGSDEGGEIQHLPASRPIAPYTMQFWKFEAFGDSQSAAEGAYVVTKAEDGTLYYLMPNRTLTTNKSDVTSSWQIDTRTDENNEVINNGLAIHTGSNYLDASNAGPGFSFWNGGNGNFYTFIEFTDEEANQMCQNAKSEYLTILENAKKFDYLWDNFDFDTKISQINNIEVNTSLEPYNRLMDYRNALNQAINGIPESKEFTLQNNRNKELYLDADDSVDEPVVTTYSGPKQSGIFTIIQDAPFFKIKTHGGNFIGTNGNWIIADDSNNAVYFDFVEVMSGQTQTISFHNSLTTKGINTNGYNVIATYDYLDGGSNWIPSVELAAQIQEKPTVADIIGKTFSIFNEYHSKYITVNTTEFKLAPIQYVSDADKWIAISVADDPNKFLLKHLATGRFAVFPDSYSQNIGTSTNQSEATQLTLADAPKNRVAIGISDYRFIHINGSVLTWEANAAASAMTLLIDPTPTSATDLIDRKFTLFNENSGNYIVVNNSATRLEASRTFMTNSVWTAVASDEAYSVKLKNIATGAYIGNAANGSWTLTFDATQAAPFSFNNDGTSLVSNGELLSIDGNDVITSTTDSDGSILECVTTPFAHITTSDLLGKRFEIYSTYNSGQPVYLTLNSDLTALATTTTSSNQTQWYAQPIEGDETKFNLVHIASGKYIGKSGPNDIIQQGNYYYQIFDDAEQAGTFEVAASIDGLPAIGDATSSWGTNWGFLHYTGEAYVCWYNDGIKSSLHIINIEDYTPPSAAVTALKNQCIRNLEALKNITTLYAVDDLTTAIDNINNVDVDSESAEETINSIYNAAVQVAAGKKITLNVIWSTNNVTRWLAESEEGVVGVEELGENGYWTLESQSADRFYIKNTGTNKYIGNGDTKNPYTTTDQTTAAGIFTLVPTDTNILTFELDNKDGIQYLTLSQTSKLEDWTDIGDKHAKWNIANVSALGSDLEEYLDAVKDNVNNIDVETNPLWSNIDDTLTEALSEALGKINIEEILNDENPLPKVSEAREKINEALIEFNAAVIKANAENNVGVPVVLKNTGRSAAATLSRSGDEGMYLAVENDEIATVNDSDDARALWIVEANRTNGRFSLRNAASTLYISAVEESAPVALSANASDAVMFLLSPSINGSVGISAGNGVTDYESLHIDSNNAVVGWDPLNHNSAWLITEPSVDVIKAMGQELYPSNGGSTESIISSLENTGLWSDSEMANLRNAIGQGYTYEGTDQKEAAAAIVALASVQSTAMTPISDKVFGISNVRLANTGFVEGTLSNTQYTYSSWLGTNGSSTAILSAPVENGQWRFEVKDNNLYLKLGESSYLKSNGKDQNISFASIDNATPVEIINQDGLIIKVGDNLAVNISDHRPQDILVYDIANSDGVVDAGNPVTFQAIEKPVADGETYYVIAAYHRFGVLNFQDTDEDAPIQTSAVNDYSYWKIKSLGGDAVQVASIVDGLYLGHNGNNSVFVTTEPTTWYLTTNASDNGVGYSLRVSQDGNRIDASQGGSGGNVGTWLGSNSDWLGTTFLFAPVNSDFINEKSDAVADRWYDSVVDQIKERVDQLYAVPQLFETHAIDYALSKLDAIKNDATMTGTEKAKQADITASDLFALAEEIPFLLVNQRRYDRAQSGINCHNGYALYYYEADENKDGWLDKWEFRPRKFTPGSSFWRLHYAGNATFTLSINNDQAYIGASSYSPVYSDGNIGRLVFRNSEPDGGEGSFCILYSSLPLNDGNQLGMNIDQLDSDESSTVSYYANDYGSRWMVQIPATLPTTDYKAGESDIFLISGLERGGMLGADLNMLVDPVDETPKNVNYNASTYWEVMSTDNNDPHRYTLRNLVTGLYLSHDRTWTEEPVEWYIRANASVAENWDEQAQGLRISVSPDGVSIDPSTPANGGGLGTWMGSTNDWTGTSWIFTRTSRAEANYAAYDRLYSQHRGYERSWVANELAEAVDELMPRWSSDPILTAALRYSEINNIADQAYNASTDYIALLAERNALWTEMNRELTANFAQQGPDHHFQILNVRRIDMGVNDDEHLLAHTDSENKTVKMSEHGESQASLWQFQPDGSGNLLLANALGGYVGAMGSASSLTSDLNAAGKFDIRLTMKSVYEHVGWRDPYPAYDETESQPTYNYRPHFYLAIGYADSGYGLNVSSQVPGLTHWAADDDGSFWILKNADAIAAIDDITVDGSSSLDDCELFTLQGQPINRRNAAPGIYVARRRDGSAFKAVIR